MYGHILIKIEHFGNKESKAKSFLLVPSLPPSRHPEALGSPVAVCPASPFATPISIECARRFLMKKIWQVAHLPPLYCARLINRRNDFYSPGCSVGRIMPLVLTEGQGVPHKQTHSPEMQDCFTWRDMEAGCTLNSN